MTFSGFHLSESEVLFVPKYWVLRILLKLCPNLLGLLSPLLEESFSTNLQFFSWSISSLFAKIPLCFGLVCFKLGWRLLPLHRRKYRLSRGRCLQNARQKMMSKHIIIKLIAIIFYRLAQHFCHNHVQMLALSDPNSNDLKTLLFRRDKFYSVYHFFITLFLGSWRITIIFAFLYLIRLLCKENLKTT